MKMLFRHSTRNCGVTVAENDVKPAMSAKMMVVLSCCRTSRRRKPCTSRNFMSALRSFTNLAACLLSVAVGWRG